MIKASLLLFSVGLSIFANTIDIEENFKNSNKIESIKEENLLEKFTRENRLTEKTTLPTTIKVPTSSDLKDIRNFQDILNNPLFKTKGGFSSGGGGNAVVCFNSTGMATELELLDYYEGYRKDMSPVKSLGISGDNVEEKIINAFSKLENDYPRLSVKLKNRALWVHENINDFLISTKEGKYVYHLPA